MARPPQYLGDLSLYIDREAEYRRQQAYYQALRAAAAAQNDPIPEPAPEMGQTPPAGPVHLDVSEPTEVATPKMAKRALDIDG